MLILGVVGSGRNTSGPRPLKYADAELPATRMVTRDEEPLGVLDGGYLVHADGRKQRGSKADQDGLAINGHAVPVMHRRQRLSVTVHVLSNLINPEIQSSLVQTILDAVENGHRQLAHLDVGYGVVRSPVIDQHAVLSVP
jgi:hypothetical protein